MSTHHRRAGFSLLELQVAFVVFGLALVGMFPLVIMQSKLLSKVESRFNPATTYYLVPSSDPWVPKLGASATIQTQDPGPKPPPAVLLIDNTTAGYSETGAGWTDQTANDAYLGTARTHSLGTGANTAVWQFTGLQPGWYDVRVTWPAGSDQATDAAYTVYDGTTNRGTFRANQSLPPFGDAYQNQLWQSLVIVPVRGSTLQVQLSDNASGRVSADAVRIISVRNALQVTGVAKSLTGEEVTASVTVTVVTPQ